MVEVLIAITFLLVASVAGNYFWPEPIDRWAAMTTALLKFSETADTVSEQLRRLGEVYEDCRRDHPHLFDENGHFLVH